MKTLGNILWHFPFFGFVSAILVYLLGLLFTVTVVAAPIGLGLMEFGKFLFVPFGNTMVSKADLNMEQNQAWKAYSTIIMVLYFPFGLFFAVLAIFQVFFLCCTIVGIPVALVIAKSLGTYLNPVNKKCVSSAVAVELERRRGQSEVDRYLSPNQAVDNRSPPVAAQPAAWTPPAPSATPAVQQRVAAAFCPDCGTPARTGGAFCGECGGKL